MSNKFIFLVFAIAVSLTLLAFIINVARKKHKSHSILIAMICGLLEIPIYCLTIFSQNYKYCYIAYTVNLMLVEWLTFFFFNFVAQYSLSRKKIEKPFKVLLIVTIIDSLLVFTNIFFGYLFDITLERNLLDYQRYHWIVTFKPSATLHFVLSYSYIGVSLGLLLRSSFKTSSFYKMRYIGIFIAYLVVVLVHVVCLAVKLDIDFSILLYGMMGAFVSYYITYTAPNQLLYQILQCYNQSADEAMLYFDEKGRLILANDEAKKIFIRDNSFSVDEAEEYCSNAVLRYVKIRYEKTIFKDSMIINGEVCDFEGEYQEFFDKRNLLGSFLRLENKTIENIRYKKQQYLANNDPLTGIFNRDYFLTQVDAILKKDPYTPRLMICSNIVDFKLVNEILGTDFGDIVLKKTAELIRRLSRADDLYCRICDDKFAVLMRKSLFDPKVFTDSFKVVQRLTESELFQIKIQVGIYEIQGDRESAQVIYDKAFLALDKQVDSTNQLFHYYDASFMEHLMEERNMVSVFEEELANGNFHLYFSPIKNASEELIAIEADSKWNNPEKGLLDSKDYVKVFEKYGVIYKLDKYIWNEAIKFLVQWNKEKQSDLRLLLQISVRDFYYLDLYKTLVELVTENDCNPENITLEFQEESISLDFREINDLFKKMQDYGFRILFNNFGAGQSSLNLLKETHLDGVKIASHLIDENEDSKKTTKIFEFIISLSNMLGLNPCINGVDTQQQFKFLKKLKLQGFQGLYCGEELTPEQFSSFYNS